MKMGLYIVGFKSISAMVWLLQNHKGCLCSRKNVPPPVPHMCPATVLQSNDDVVTPTVGLLCSVVVK